MINFDITRADCELVTKIAKRAHVLAGMKDRAFYEIEMDITACHQNGTPLDLDKLLAFDDFNFAHDLYGIAEHLDRETGELRHCFLPRCARPESCEMCHGNAANVGGYCAHCGLESPVDEGMAHEDRLAGSHGPQHG